MISVKSWLKSFGFNTNPFETTEAEGEANYATDFLHATFVKPVGFDEILGHPTHPESSLIFASRGKGKSSTCLMTAHFCKNGLFESQQNYKGQKKTEKKVLPVLYTRFEKSFDFMETPRKLINAHINEILYRAIPAFVDILLDSPEIIPEIIKLDIYRRLELQLLLVMYQIYVPIKEFKEARDILGKEIVYYDKENALVEINLPNHIELLLGLSSQETKLRLQERTKQSPLDRIALFASLLAETGIEAVYILIDGIDEMAETVSNFDAAAKLLLPLIAEIELMKRTPHLAFKIFVPLEMKTAFLEDNQLAREDRISIYDIQLDDKGLIEMLNRRISHCSDDVVMSMDAVSVPELRGQIESDLLAKANGNPRRLILLANYMIANRCAVVDETGDEDAYLLRAGDLKEAVQSLPKELKQASELPKSVVEITKNKYSDNKSSSSNKWYRHKFSSPLAYSYLVYERESVGHRRLWKIYELVEASLAFSSQILLALMYQNLKSNMPTRIQKSGLRFERMSFGAWRVVLEKIPGMIASSGIRSRFSRACQRTFNRHHDFILSINEERNRSAHDGTQSDKICNALLEKYEEPLHQYLDNLSFLRDYSLIKVLSVQKQKKIYLHQCTSYIGDVGVYPSKEIALNQPLDSDVLWFLGDNEAIKLHPLIIVSSKEAINEEIYLYQRGSKESITYKHYGTGRTKSKTDIVNILAKQ